MCCISGSSLLEKRRLQQFSYLERLRKEKKIAYGGVPPPCRCSAPGHGGCIRYEPPGPARVADGATQDVFALWTGIGVQHARRYKDMFANIALVRFVAHQLDDPAQQDKSVIGVLHTCARLELDRPVSEESDVVREGSGFEAMRLILWCENVSGASRVAEHFTDGHAGSQVPVGVIGPVGCDRLIERKFPLCHKLQNRN